MWAYLAVSWGSGLWHFRVWAYVFRGGAAERGIIHLEHDGDMEVFSLNKATGMAQLLDMCGMRHACHKLSRSWSLK